MKTIPTIETSAFSDVSFDTIDSAHEWINRDGAPRDECFMSTVSEPYTYGSGRGIRTYYPIPFTWLILAIRDKLANQLGFKYEACFSNRYEDERKHLGWHADDSPSIDHNYGITVISFGAEREIWFRENESKDVEKISMPHGSMLIMPAGFQSTHQHRIPKHSRACGPRISLTWRKLIAT